MDTSEVADGEGFQVELIKHGIHSLMHHIADLSKHVVLWRSFPTLLATGWVATI